MLVSKRSSMALFTSEPLNLAPASLYSQVGALVSQLQPLRIQSARVLCPEPPREPSMLTIWKPPGPTIPRVRVVATPKQGQPGPASSGCVLMIANGAAPQALPSTSARATAVALTSAELIPSALRK